VLGRESPIIGVRAAGFEPNLKELPKLRETERKGTKISRGVQSVPVKANVLEESACGRGRI